MLRPQLLKDVIGQEQLKERLSISISSAKQLRQPLDHILYNGPPGVGKTTLAHVIANEMGVPIQIANGANLRSIKRILPYIFSIKPNSVFLIDEVHRLTKVVEEFIYPLMEDFRVDLVSKEEVVNIKIDPFTLIGSTTLSGILAPPFYDRFGIHEELNLYSISDLTNLVLKRSQELQLKMGMNEATVIAQRSRGTPRIAQNLLKWIRDICVVKKMPPSVELIKRGMKLKGIDDQGLTRSDRKYLHILRTQFKGGPVGIDTLSSAIGISKETIVNIIEPYLIHCGLINKTIKGRIIS